MIDDGGDRTYKHHEQFQGESVEQLTPGVLRLERPNRKLVVMNTPDDIKVLDACLVETDTDTTEVVVVTAHPASAAGVYGDPEHTEMLVVSGRSPSSPDPLLGNEDARLMTTVVNRAELVGKPVKPAILLSDDPQAAVLLTTQVLGAQELILAHNGIEPCPLQLDRLVDRYREIMGNLRTPLTIRMIGSGLDECREIYGGTRIPPEARDDGEAARSLAGSGTD